MLHVLFLVPAWLSFQASSSNALPDNQTEGLWHRLKGLVCEILCRWIHVLNSLLLGILLWLLGLFFFFPPQLQASKHCSSRRSVVITTDIIITSHYVITQWTYCKYGSCESSTLQLGRYEKNPTVSIFQILLARYLQPPHTPWPLACL